MNLNGQVCIITGATSGIGKETAIELAKKGVRLVLPVRSVEKGESLMQHIHTLTGNGHVDVMRCDLASLDSVRSFSREFLSKYDRLDILINNAGIWESKRKESDDGIELTFAVNHLAPFLLTYLLTDLLIASAPARVINISSEAHRYVRMRFDDPEGKKRWSGFGSYARSKLANILFTMELARKMNGAGVTVNCLHPGVVNTHLFDKLPKLIISMVRLLMNSPKKGAQTTCFLATSTEVKEVTAQYFSNKKTKRVARQARNEEDARRLWEASMGYLNGKGNIWPH